MNLASRLSSVPRGPLHVVVDSSGVKVYGEGEWKVRFHGLTHRREWRKLHLALAPETQEIVAHVLTTSPVGDAGQVEPLLNQVGRSVKSFMAPAAMIRGTCTRRLPHATSRRSFSIRKNASLRQHGNCAGAPLPRDENLRQIRRLGRRGWKRAVGYHRRSLVETAFSRLKRIFGDVLKNRHLLYHRTEAALRCKLLNHFTRLGLPKFIWTS